LVTQAISKVLGVNVQAINHATTFVGLGGDSLSAILISAECQKLGISISAGVFIRSQTLDEAIADAVLSAHIIPAPSISQPLSTLLQQVEYKTETNASIRRGISAKDVLDQIDATRFTESQLLLLRGSLANPNLNIVTLKAKYTGWNIDTVCQAWKSVILTEPIFEDLIYDLKITPQQFLQWQKIRAESKGHFKRELSVALKESTAISSITTIQAPQDENQITFVWRIHHSFIDGYSARVLRSKVLGWLKGEMVAPGPSHKNTMALLRTFQDERRISTRHFWANKREQYPTATSELCLSPQKRVNENDANQKCITVQFPDEQLVTVTRITGYTKAVYFAAAWALTLSKFMDTNQVSFGLVFSGRDLPIPGSLDTVGPLMNILPLFATTEVQNGSWDNFLRQVRQGILELNEFQYSEAADGFSRHFDSVMATQFDCDEAISKTPTSLGQHRSDMQSGVPLNLIIEQKSCVQMLYSTTHYTEEDAVNIRSVFINSMNSLLQDDTKLCDILPLEIEDQIRHWSNCYSEETFESSKGDDLVTLFENVVARRPNDVAVVQSDFEMSYDIFDQAAAVIARELSWIEPNEVVCVFADRSVNWLVAIFGILKAGGVYAPLDPSAPITVRQSNFERSGARTLIVPASASRLNSLQNQNGKSSVQYLVVEELLTAAKVCDFVAYARRRIARPDDLAYICFTSGSTGRPKAVQCTHKGLVAFQKDRDVRLAAGRGIVVAQVMSPVFDGSIHEIFSALTYGATLRLPSPDQEEPFSHLQQSNSGILTPSIAKALCPEQYPRLKYMYLVGEAVPQSVCDAWGEGRLLFNMYGPTEATGGATIKRLLSHQTVSLGHPNPSSRVYILDRNHCLLPPGAVGELYLAGIQVSNGYINLPDENNNRFLNDLVLPKANQMMYKTGDFGYWDSATGEICLLGRKDRQIKLRGFRLDLDDLEARVVKGIPGCEGAAIFRRDDYLVAFYVAPLGLDSTQAKSYIRQALPPYAIPRNVIAIEKFPLTLAGKLDYKALQRINIDVTKEVHQPPKRMTATEKILVGSIRGLLGFDDGMEIDQKSDFMMLGAHSILQLKLANEISSCFGQRITVRTVIENPIISALASAIDAELQGKQDLGQLHPKKENASLGERGISPIELDWFNKYKKSLGTSSFNVSHVSRLEPDFKQHEKLVLAWNTVLARHSILRCRFTESARGVERTYSRQVPRAQVLESFDAREELNREFLLGEEDPIRILISKSDMLICISHIICDYTTLNRLFEEFTSEFFDNGLPISERRYQDTDWNLKTPQRTAQFWTECLSGMDLFVMPCMKTCRTSYAGESLLLKLTDGTMSSMRLVSRSWGLTMHQIALGIVSLVLQADSPLKQDMVLGSPFLGRQENDMHTVGLFLQPLPIRIPRSDPKASITAFLKAVQQSAQACLSHGMDWGALMELLANSNNDDLRTAANTPAPNHPLFNTMVTFHELDSTPSNRIDGIKPVVSWAEGSKFAIMFEFTAVSASRVTLRLEYDSDLFSHEEVCKLAARVNLGLELLCQNLTVEELEQNL
ncbi:hypothetical protein GQ44DRAFT_587702, partial [Phaeosphaeriaceae sp. PMI808]